MAYKQARRVDVGALVRAPFAALQWRLLLLWLVFLLLPTAIVAWPLWRVLAGLLDHSVHAAAWAQHLDGFMLAGVSRAISEQIDWLRGVSTLAMLLTVLIGPFLAGMTVAAGRAGRVLGLGQLLQSGVIEYGRMFRVLLWSLLPYAAVIGGAKLVFDMTDKHANLAVLESRADLYQHLALAVVGVLFVLAHAMVESARAAFITDAGLRSATRAFGRGVMQLLRRPASTLVSYLLIGVVGYGIALGFGLWRLHTPAIGLGGFMLALLLSQLAMLAIGWARITRLFALAEVGRSLQTGRGGSGLPPSLQ